MKLNYIHREILDQLDTVAGRMTRDIAKHISIQDSRPRAHSQFVRMYILQLEKAGLVRKLDDKKPVCWVKVS